MLDKDRLRGPQLVDLVLAPPESVGSVTVSWVSSYAEGGYECVKLDLPGDPRKWGTIIWGVPEGTIEAGDRVEVVIRPLRRHVGNQLVSCLIDSLGGPRQIWQAAVRLYGSGYGQGLDELGKMLQANPMDILDHRAFYERFVKDNSPRLPPLTFIG